MQINTGIGTKFLELLNVISHKDVVGFIVKFMQFSSVHVTMLVGFETLSGVVRYSFLLPLLCFESIQFRPSTHHEIHEQINKRLMIKTPVRQQ